MGDIEFSEELLQHVTSFVDVLRNNPQIIHHKDLGFFRDYLKSLGTRLPAAEDKGNEFKPSQASGDSAGAKGSTKAEEPDLDEEPDEPYPELDEEGVVDADPQNLDQVMGDPEASVSDEDLEKSNQLKSEAIGHYNEGDFEKAVEKYTEAIKLNGGAAILLAKRGQAYLQLKKPNACIKDCNRALQINPDSAIAFKFRGRAHRLLGHWEQAASDLRQACKIDFDDQADGWLKEVTPNARKIEEWNLRKKRREEEREIKLRKLRAQERQRAHAEATARGSADDDEGMGMPPGAGMFGGIPGLDQIMNDPEVVELFADPEVSAAFADVGQNPMNILKYQSNPKVAKLLAILKKKMGGLGGLGGMGGFPGFGGMPGGGMPQFDPSAFAGAQAPPGPTPPAPGDDLD